MCINAFVVFHVGEMLKISMSENASSIKILLFFFVCACEILCDYVHLPLCYAVLYCICMSSQMSYLLHITLKNTFKGQMFGFSYKKK